MNKKIAVIGSVVALSVLVPTAAVIYKNVEKNNVYRSVYSHVVAGQYSDDIASIYDSIPSNAQSSTIIGMCAYDQALNGNSGIKVVNFIPPTQSEVKACEYVDSSWEKANGHMGRNMTVWYPLYADGHISKIGLFGVYKEGQLEHFPLADKIGSYEMMFRDNSNKDVSVYRCKEVKEDCKFSQLFVSQFRGVVFQVDVIGGTDNCGFIPAEYLRCDKGDLYISRKGLGKIFHDLGGQYDMNYGFNAKAPYVERGR